MTRYFEDLTEGQTHEFGTETVSGDEIKRFADRYDPQSFHVDEAAADESIFGGLIASGWQTVAVAQRLLVDSFLGEVANVSGRGADEIQWHRPVRPGDTLSGHVEVIDTSASSHPERGDVSMKVTCRNQADEVVLTMKLHVIVRRNSAANTT